jgi:EmrB/QacA subfamily drug resistance transporter
VAAAKAAAAVLWACVLGSSLSFIDGSVVNVSLPAMAADLKASGEQVQWIINGYMLPLAALVLLGGALGDRYGRRNAFLLGVLGFGAGTVVCALAPVVEVLLAGRVLQGLASALLVPASLALLGETYPKEEDRAKAVGTWAAAGALGGALGPVAGGWLTDVVGWRAIFVGLLPIVAATLALGVWAIPKRPPETSQPLDLPGAALATLGLGAVTWGLTEYSRTRTTGGLMIAGVGAVLLAAFLMVERGKGAKAMMPLSLFTRTFNGVTLLTFLLYAALRGLLFLVPLYLVARGWSATLAGAALLPFPLLMGFGSRLTGGWASRTGPRLWLTAGPVVVGIGFALLGRMAATDFGYWSHVFPGVVVIGIGMTMAVAPLTDTVLASVDEKHQGSASGINNATARVAGLLAVALAGFALAGQAVVPPESFQLAAWVAAGCAVLSGLAAWVLIGKAANGAAS